MFRYRNALRQLAGKIFLNKGELESALTYTIATITTGISALARWLEPKQHKPIKFKLVYPGLACALFTVIPNFAVAQSSPTDVPVIGYLAWWPCETPSSMSSNISRGLTDLGHKPGETIMIECRSANQSPEGLTTAAAELVELRVDMIVSTSEPAARAAYGATKTIPIVSIFSGDPISAGMARSLAQPGGNATGVSYYATELTGKRLDLLKTAVPKLTTIDVLSNPDVSYFPFEEDTKRAAGLLGIAVRVHHVRTPTDIDNAFATMKAENAQAVFVLPDLMLAGEGSRIAALAIEQKLPSMTWGSWYANEGCLLAYSTRYDELQYRLGYYIDRILKGAKPGDLPIEQPTQYSLSVNLKTANILGLKLPQTLLLQADNFIE